MKSWILPAASALTLSLTPTTDATIFSTTAQPNPPIGTWPLQISGGVLRTNSGAPYLLIADSGWDLLGNVTFCSTITDPTCNGSNNIAYYFQQRAKAGFNTALVALFCDSYVTCQGNSGATFDGTLPFTGSVGGCSPAGFWPCWDLSKPNAAYFTEAVNLVKVAAFYGMTVGWVPINNAQCPSNAYGQQALLNNTAAAVSGYGVFLGTTFKPYSNVIWLEGNDYTCWTTHANDNPNYSIALGLINGGNNAIQTLEVDNGGAGAGPSNSLTDTTNNWANVLGLNGGYSYFTTYGVAWQGYAQSSTIPSMIIETNYQGQDNSGQQNSSGVTGCSTSALVNPPYCPLRERQQEWWAATAGANAGQFTGNGTVYQFASGWINLLNTVPDQQFVYMSSFLQTINWYKLKPDTGFTFAYCTSPGTSCGTNDNNGGNNVTSNLVTAAVTSDNKQAVVYYPNAYSSSVIVNMGKFATGPVSGQWFDPTLNTYSAVSGSPFTNSGTQTIAKKSGTHSDSTADWVLLLKAP